MHGCRGEADSCHSAMHRGQSGATTFRPTGLTSGLAAPAIRAAALFQESRHRVQTSFPAFSASPLFFYTSMLLHDGRQSFVGPISCNCFICRNKPSSLPVSPAFLIYLLHLAHNICSATPDNRHLEQLITNNYKAWKPKLRSIKAQCCKWTRDNSTTATEGILPPHHSPKPLLTSPLEVQWTLGAGNCTGTCEG